MTDLPRPVSVADLYLAAVLDELKAIKLQLIRPEPEAVDGEEIELKEVGEAIPLDFPGYAAFVEAGIFYMDDVPNKGDALVAIPGIGKATANKILTWFKV
jgi:hypothetical protein